MNFYISDNHFGHENIIKFCNRPFKNADEMDKIMIDNWNKVVTNNDTVYILGDVVFSKGKKSPKEYLRQLNGKKVMITGNHDYEIVKNPDKYKDIFEGIYNYLEISDTVDGKNYRLALFHYPILEWNGFFRDTIHLYGHIHNSKNDSYKIMKVTRNAYNVGADVLNFTPQRLKDVVLLNKLFFA